MAQIVEYEMLYVMIDGHQSMSGTRRRSVGERHRLQKIENSQRNHFVLVSLFKMDHCVVEIMVQSINLNKVIGFNDHCSCYSFKVNGYIKKTSFLVF